MGDDVKKIILICSISFVFLLAGCMEQTEEQTSEERIEEKEKAQKEIYEGFQMDVSVKEENETLKMKVSVTNQTKEDTTFMFLNEFLYYFFIQSENEETVYDSRETTKQKKHVQEMLVKKGETITFEESWDMMRNGEKIPTGTYTITGGILVTKTDNIELDEDALTKTIVYELK